MPCNIAIDLPCNQALPKKSQKPTVQERCREVLATVKAGKLSKAWQNFGEASANGFR